MTFQNALSSPLYYCVAILSEDNTYVHIIGGFNAKQSIDEEMKKGIELKVEEEEDKKKENEMDKIINKKREWRNNTKQSEKKISTLSIAL
ncbi:hypothetical protein RFI_29627 [Reticulomyxa filosa]|uniref:Uncharacterized protein n=1 Tax=Reticulomyxa filosa TaxID=46433 RepID=X6M2T4_RETFI|nr:hypothetical protein RFI_29627 [Reticulomyxa filosa]|eukprot:ETO07762.1 hypothetical protein RFI_29627 [Reticulomyxa filosa]